MLEYTKVQLKQKKRKVNTQICKNRKEYNLNRHKMQLKAEKTHFTHKKYKK